MHRTPLRASLASSLYAVAVLACGPHVEVRDPPVCAAVAKETASAAPKEEASTRPIPRIQDGLLDSLVGEWRVTGIVREKQKTEKVVRVAWVLNHQFVELHYRDRATPSTYEALVYIGPDGAGTYVAHWMDVYGGKMSARGRGSREGNAIEFTFDYPDGPFYNTYTFDHGTNAWTSLMRTKAKDGKWVVFAEEHFRRE